MEEVNAYLREHFPHVPYKLETVTYEMIKHQIRRMIFNHQRCYGVFMKLHDYENLENDNVTVSFSYNKRGFNFNRRWEYYNSVVPRTHLPTMIPRFLGCLVYGLQFMDQSYGMALLDMLDVMTDQDVRMEFVFVFPNEAIPRIITFGEIETRNIRELKEASECCVCLDEHKKFVLFDKCTHMVCVSCSDGLRQHGTRTCPMCRTPI